MQRNWDGLTPCMVALNTATTLHALHRPGNFGSRGTTPRTVAAPVRGVDDWFQAGGPGPTRIRRSTRPVVRPPNDAPRLVSTSYTTA